MYNIRKSSELYLRKYDFNIFLFKKKMKKIEKNNKFHHPHTNTYELAPTHMYKIREKWNGKKKNKNILMEKRRNFLMLLLFYTLLIFPNVEHNNFFLFL